MSRICVWTMSLCITTALVSLCNAKSEYWPDYSCHPFNDTTMHSNAVKFSRMAWYSCQETYEKFKGRCDKVCLLLNRAVFVRTKKDDNKFENIFDMDRFVNLLRREMGYKDGEALPGNADGIAKKVRLEATECTKKYPEFAQLNLKGHSCDPWKNLFQCLDKSIGCGLW